MCAASSKLAVYAPISYILPSRLRKYEEIYDTQVEGGRGKLRQADRERSLQALMTTNLLKRLESSVEAFRLTLRALSGNIAQTIQAIESYERTGGGASVTDHLGDLGFDPDDDELTGLDEFTVGKKIQISLADMDLPSWKHDLGADLALIRDLIASMDKVGPEDDANAPIAKTFRPRREDSVDFDESKNLIIEGDNLDALKPANPLSRKSESHLY